MCHFAVHICQNLCPRHTNIIRVEKAIFTLKYQVVQANVYKNVNRTSTEIAVCCINLGNVTVLYLRFSVIADVAGLLGLCKAAQVQRQ